MLALAVYLCVPVLIAQAHSGRTASDGCHYCRTNCAKYGEVQDQRHCHNTPKPKPPTPKPDPKPEPEPTPPPIPTCQQQSAGTCDGKTYNKCEQDDYDACKKEELFWAEHRVQINKLIQKHLERDATQSDYDFYGNQSKDINEVEKLLLAGEEYKVKQEKEEAAKVENLDQEEEEEAKEEKKKDDDKKEVNLQGEIIEEVDVKKDPDQNNDTGAVTNSIFSIIMVIGSITLFSALSALFVGLLFYGKKKK